MIPGKFLCSADLLAAQAFSIYKPAEIVMIGKYKNFEFAALQVVASGFKGLHYGQQFLIIGFVPSLCRNHFLREKGYGVPLTGLRG